MIKLGFAIVLHASIVNAALVRAGTSLIIAIRIAGAGDRDATVGIGKHPLRAQPVSVREIVELLAYVARCRPPVNTS